MQILYGKKFTQSELEDLRIVIRNNIICSMKILVEQAPEYGEISEERQDDMMELAKMHEYTEMTQINAAVIRRLWMDNGVQAAFKERNNFQLPSSAGYFFDRLKEIAAEDYEPSIDDVLRSRVRTSGIVESDYIIDGVDSECTTSVVERNERKKWIHCFENVTAVIFVAAISEYDEVLFEDTSQNRIVEAINLFEEISNSRWFSNSSIILFLNKVDLFKEKICRKKIEDTDIFSDCTAKHDYNAGIEYMQQKFLSVAPAHMQKNIYCHPTCATNTNNVAFVFDSCRQSCSPTI